MSRGIDALMIFCEGPHDSAFVRMVLGNLMGYTVEKLKFSEMPSPFHRLFETAVKTHAAQDMSLDMAHKFFLPDTVLRKDDTVVFLFNCGGKTQYDKVRTLLSSFIPLYTQAKTFVQGAKEVAQSVKYLFLYDADAEGIDKIVAILNREFSKIGEIDFIDDSWQNTKSKFGKIAKDKAVFVWGGSPEKGTLEDILMPMFDFDAGNKVIMEKAKTTISDMFTWELTHAKAVRSVAESEKYQKAVLTTAGQRKKPGSSLNVILEQSGLISEDAIRSCKITAGFVEFINDFFKVEQ